jgi:hypothetical protein
MPAAADSQGTNFVFNNSTITVTNISISGSVNELDASHLGQASGSKRLLQAAPLTEADEITIDYLGTTLVTRGQSATLTIGGASYGTATCYSSSLTYAVGELVKGNATFKVS